MHKETRFLSKIITFMKDIDQETGFLGKIVVFITDIDKETRFLTKLTINERFLQTEIVLNSFHLV
jgi:hypothetical protein